MQQLVDDDASPEEVLAEYLRTYRHEDKNHVVRTERILDNWQRWRAQRGFPEGVDTEHRHGPACMQPVIHLNHTCTPELCSGRKHYPPHLCTRKRMHPDDALGGCLDNMMLIAPSLSLYGCAISGQHHFCSAVATRRCLYASKEGNRERCQHANCISRARVLEGDECTETVQDSEGCETCIFSGASLRMGTSHTFENPTKKRHAFFSDHASATSNGGDEDDRSSSSSSGQAEQPPKELEISSSSVRRKKPRRRVSIPSSAAPDPAKKLDSMRALASRARVILFELLFDQRALDSYDAQQASRRDSLFISESSMYLKDCSRLSKRIAPRSSAEHYFPPFLSVIMEIYSNAKRLHPPAPRADKNVSERLAHHYAYMCVRMWKILNRHQPGKDHENAASTSINTSPSLSDIQQQQRQQQQKTQRNVSCTFRQFVIGLLYMLKNGLQKEGVKLSEPDVFLDSFLPRETDLGHFFGQDSVERQRIASSRKHRNTLARRRKLEEDATAKKRRTEARTLEGRTEQEKVSSETSSLSRHRHDGGDSDSASSKTRPGEEKRTRSIYQKSDITSGKNAINRAIIDCPLEQLERALHGDEWSEEDYLALF